MQVMAAPGAEDAVEREGGLVHLITKAKAAHLRLPHAHPVYIDQAHLLPPQRPGDEQLVFQLKDYEDVERRLVALRRNVLIQVCHHHHHFRDWIG